ncbi:conserved hypothetical protein [Trichinella spiralis]|uniref:hypothetical protein n=1 Tax=Trichinella spiralis TaxID=6334 RepID=UPI0001EFD89B|nr:conserved hypothetical protein [Trichinella spiralis]
MFTMKSFHFYLNCSLNVTLRYYGRKIRAGPSYLVTQFIAMKARCQLFLLNAEWEHVQFTDFYISIERYEATGLRKRHQLHCITLIPPVASILSWHVSIIIERLLKIPMS